MEGERQGDHPASRGLGRVPVPAVFIAVLVSLATLVLGGNTWLAYRAESRVRREGLRLEVATLADQLATSLTLPVWHLDHQQINRILDHLMENPLVQDVSVDIQAGGLETIYRSRERAVEGREPGGVRSERAITYSGRPLGRVRLAFTTRFAEEALAAFLRQSLAFMVGLDLLLVASLFLLLWWVVLRPLREIRRLAGLVSSGADVAVLPAGAAYFGEFASVHSSLLRTFDLLKQDIAARERSEAALQEREERYRTFFEHGPDGIVVLDTETARILEFNDQACRQLGYSREEFRNLSMSDLEVSESLQETLGRIRKVMKSGLDDFMTLQRTKQGDLRDIHVTAQYIQVGGEHTYHCVWRDVTERKASEAERRQLHSQLLQAQKMESLGLLAGGLAHDMNNVLGAILGLASSQVEARPADGTRQIFETIIKACERGGKMVGSLLRFARATPVEEREVDLNALLREEVLLLEHTTLAKVRLDLDLDAGVDPITGDLSALTNLFMNLCVNAVDAMPGGGTLTLRTRRLDGWVEAQVVDTGTGMPKEVLAKAFDPFFTTKGPGKGTGLGLSMAFSTVAAHHGQIELQSELGRGTCVSIRFPATGPARAASSDAAEAPPAPPRASLQVLVVDDDDLVRESTRYMLEALGHVVLPASSGEEALRSLEAGLTADLMILDLNMPGIGGAGTLERVAQRDPHLPVLLATGRADQTALDLVRDHPQATLLAKPFSLKELRKRFEALGG